MDSAPCALNLRSIGVKTNKYVTKQILAAYKLRPSGKRGNGLYAARNIFKDEEIIRVVGPSICPKIAETLYWSYGIDVAIPVGIEKYILPINETRFINHSCEPNIGFSGAGIFVAMRDIRKGEELTYDYSICDIDNDYIIDCFCGTKSCRSRISGQDIFDENLHLAQKYKGYIPQYVLREIKRRNKKESRLFHSNGFNNRFDFFK